MSKIDIIRLNLENLSKGTLYEISKLVMLDLSNQLVKGSKISIDDNAEHSLKELLFMVNSYKPKHDEVLEIYDEIRSTFQKLCLKSILELQNTHISMVDTIEKFTSKPTSGAWMQIQMIATMGLSTRGAPGEKSDKAKEIEKLEKDPIFSKLFKKQ